MKMAPWRRTTLPLFPTSFDDLWKEMLGDERPFTSHLPEAFDVERVPPVNITEDDESLVITLDLPGVDAKDVDVEVTGNVLVVKGERTWETEKKEKRFLRRESQFGSFERTIPLPHGLETDEVKAHFEKGILEIRLKKLEPTPTKKVPIKG